MAKLKSKKKSEMIKQIILAIFFIMLCVCIVFPFVLLINASFSTESDISYYGYTIIPKHFTLQAYDYLFSNPKTIIDAYKVTIFYSVVSMFLSVLFMSMYAFALTKKKLRGRAFLSFYIYFTSLFGGGMVPTYIIMTKYLHLGDTIWIYIITGLVVPWYVFMIRTFFQGIPESIFESVKIDGGGEYTIFFKFILPLSKPVLATVALFMFLGKWNDYMISMLYIDNQSLISLQYLLQRMLSDVSIAQNSEIKSQLLAVGDIPTESVKMATAILVAGPVLFVFPFFQKYFVKGLTVGSVKG